jgi:hypothetical protein
VPVLQTHRTQNRNNLTNSERTTTKSISFESQEQGEYCALRQNYKKEISWAGQLAESDQNLDFRPVADQGTCSHNQQRPPAPSQSACKMLPFDMRYVLIREVTVPVRWHLWLHLRSRKVCQDPNSSPHQPKPSSPNRASEAPLEPQYAVVEHEAARGGSFAVFDNNSNSYGYKLYFFRIRNSSTLSEHQANQTFFSPN